MAIAVFLFKCTGIGSVLEMGFIKDYTVYYTNHNSLLDVL